jgi:hypothetical protein
MKIENFNLNLFSQEVKSFSVEGLFESELISFEQQNSEQFVKVLEYQMVQKLIVMLQGLLF